MPFCSNNIVGGRREASVIEAVMFWNEPNNKSHWDFLELDPEWRAFSDMTILAAEAVAADARFEGLLGFLGNRLPDREERVRRFFFTAAAAYPRETFLLGGNGWDASCGAPANVGILGHADEPGLQRLRAAVGEHLRACGRASGPESPLTLPRLR